MFSGKNCVRQQRDDAIWIKDTTEVLINLEKAVLFFKKKKKKIINRKEIYVYIC